MNTPKLSAAIIAFNEKEHPRLPCEREVDG